MDVLSGDLPPVPGEGTLAPDSYEVKIGAERADIIAKMQMKQGAWLADAWAARDADIAG